MRINFTFTIEDKPKWWYKIFFCRHEMVMIETDPFSDGSKSSWIECRKCGLHLSKAQDNCRHEPNSFGLCFLCNKRVAKFDCKHEGVVKDKELGYEWCQNCGEEF